MSSLVLGCGNNAERAAQRVLSSRRQFIRGAVGAAGLLAFPHTAKPANTLLTGLVSYWKLDEESGTRYDSHGNNDLTDNNTVGYAAGALNSAADFEKDSSEYLEISHANQTDLRVTGDVSLSLWFKLENLPAAWSRYTFAGKSEPGVFFTWGFDDSGVQRMYMSWWNSGWTGTQSNECALTAGTWCHLGYAFNFSTITSYFYYNGSLVSSASAAGGPYLDYSEPFWLGRAYYGNYLDGLMDEVGYWKRLLVADDFATLYNSGTPLLYASFASDAPIRWRDAIVW